MRHLLYFMIVVLLISSCDEGEPSHSVPVELELQMLPHNSNNEFYAGVPVKFSVNVKGASSWPDLYELELSVDGSRIEAQHSFAEPGAYQVKAFVRRMSDKKRYEFDTLMNIVKGPSLIGGPERGEKVLFGWKTGANYKVLMGTYYGSSALDYEVLSVNESLEQQGMFKRMDLDTYPDFIDHGASASGSLAIVYDSFLEIYDASLDRKFQFSFRYGRGPAKMFIKDNHAVLLFDSLAHITLKTVDMNTGQMVKGSTHFIGVHDMTVYDHYFRDESRTATYYIGPGNSRTLLMGVHVGQNVEFTQYFQPPVFIKDITPLSSGGYVISALSSEGPKLSILVADESNLVKWSRTYTMSFTNFWYQSGGYRTAVKELGGFIYIFFDNMRCIKLSMRGQLIWDKYFYPETTRFEDVLVTSNGEFIIIGTCMPDTNDNIDYQKRTDVLCIRINTDGFRVRPQ